MYEHQNGNRLIAILSWHLMGMAEENHKNLIMVCFRTRLESGSDFTALGSLYIVTSLLLQPFKQHLIKITLFSLTKSFYSRSVSFKCTNNLGSIFTNHLDHRIYDTKFQTHISCPFSMCYLSYHLNFSFNVQNLLLFMIAAMLLPVSSCTLQE